MERTNKLKSNLMALSMMLSIPILNISYPLLNNCKRGAYNLVTDLDKVIPFLKIFIIPYVSWYAFIILTLAFLCFKDRKTYYKTLVSLNIGLIVCYFIYFLFQTTVPRPDLMADDTLTKLVRLIYASDQPYNCFPSIHVLTCQLMVEGIKRSKAKNSFNLIFIKSMSLLIILSTLFIKQHVVLDVFSAMLLANGIYRFVDSYKKERVVLWVRKLYLLLTMKKKLEI